MRNKKIHYLVLATAYFRLATIIGSTKLNFSVRNGKRCDLCDESPTLKNGSVFSIILTTAEAGFVTRVCTREWFTNFLTGIETLVLLSLTHYCAST